MFELEKSNFSRELLSKIVAISAGTYTPIFFKTIIFILLFLFIVDLVPPVFNYDLYIDKIIRLGLYIKIIKYTTINLVDWNMVICNYPLICGLKPHLPFILLGLVSMLIMLICDNIIFITLNILALVFIKALCRNFHDKHFKFYRSNVKEFINYLRNNVARIVIFFFKLIIASVLIRIIVRGSVFLLLNGNDDIASNILVILLSIAIYYYILNFVIKLIKKEKIVSDDYNIHNKYVIEKVNLYNIAYIISINLMIKYFYSMYIVVIISIIFVAIIYFIFNSKLYEGEIFKPKIVGASSVLQLKSAAGKFVIPFIAFSVYLQESCDTGFKEALLLPKEHLIPFKVYDTRVIGMNRTINIVKSTDHSLALYHPDELNKPITPYILNNVYRISRSPVVHMANKQIEKGLPKHGGIKWDITPRSFFINEDFVGSVCHVGTGNFYIINIIKHKSEGCSFMPSFYLKDNSIIHDYVGTIGSTHEILTRRYGIDLPFLKHISGGVVIFTQGEHIGGYNGLYKFWRPSPYFLDPNFISKTVKDYYKLEASKEKQNEPLAILKMRRAGNFVNIPKLNEIKGLVWENTLDKVENKPEDEARNILALRSKEYIFDNEYKADYIYQILLKNFFNKSNNSSDNSLVGFKQVNRNEKESMTKDKLLSLYKKPEYKYPLPWDEHYGEIFFKNYSSKFKGDASGSIKYNLRRDFSIDWQMWNMQYNISCYASLSKIGVIQGRDRPKWDVPIAGYDEDFNPNYGKYCTLSDSIDSIFSLGFEQSNSRLEFLDRLSDSYEFASTNTNLTEMYGISINRFSFELLSIKFNFAETGRYQERYELYSIIDTTNSEFHLYELKDKPDIYMPVCKQNFNFLDNNDELSIRKFLDFIFTNNNGNLPYLSDNHNY